MALHKACSRCADTDKEVERMFGKQGTQIFDKGALHAFAAQPGSCKRMIEMSIGQGDCRASSLRMNLPYSLQGLKSRPNE